MPGKFDPSKTRKYSEDRERRLQALTMWMEEHTYQQIADELGYHDRATAHRAVQLAKKEMPEAAADAREKAFNRIMGPLLTMRAQAMPGKVRNPETGEEIDRPGDPAAAAQYKGLEERLAKLLGLDAPVKTDVTSDGEKITINVVPDWQTGAPGE